MSGHNRLRGSGKTRTDINVHNSNCCFSARDLEILSRHAFGFESPAVSVDLIDRGHMAAGSMIDAPIRAMAKAHGFEAEDFQDMPVRLRRAPKADRLRMLALVFGYILRLQCAHQDGAVSGGLFS